MLPTSERGSQWMNMDLAGIKKAPFPGPWGVSVDLDGSPETLGWWRRRELNPRPPVLSLEVYMFSVSLLI
jgi:hypothetical protein